VGGSGSSAGFNLGLGAKSKIGWFSEVQWQKLFELFPLI